MSMMVEFRLSNIVLNVDDYMAGYEDVYYRADEEAVFEAAADALSFSGSLDFLTYFNALSLAKWRRYTVIDSVRLHLELIGDACVCSVLTIGEDGGIPRESQAIELGGQGAYDSPVGYDIDLPFDGSVLVGFKLTSKGRTGIRNAYYHTMVDEAKVRSVRLALCTTTFMKEEYIVPNIEAVKREVLHSAEAISANFHMFVVDNGRTLDPAALNSKGVSVLPNANAGGAGGFARGMLEALGAGDGFTHVLLMDDDVRVSPESFKRTFNLLSLANDRYRDAFISGAMLVFETPNRQYEDVSFVRNDGTYERIKPDLYIDRLDDIVKNETTDVEVGNAYGAWWYCCIPTKAIEEQGLPLPFFVRCDDVEYGLRCQPAFMTMGGICVWHAGFDGRFKASVDCYQYVRNYLIMAAMDGGTSDEMFLMRTAWNLRICLRTMAYETAELLIDGLEGYLKGPGFLATVDGEALLKENGKKDEKLVPLSELDAAVMGSLEIDHNHLGEKIQPGLAMKLWRTLPYDRHWLPDFMLRDKPATACCNIKTPLGPHTVGCKTLVVFDIDGKSGHIRTIDKERWRAIRRRWNILRREYKDRAEELRRAYKDAQPYLTSREFWVEYLHLSEPMP